MACICRRHAVVLPSSRAFSTTSRQNVSLHLKSNLKEDIAEIVPAYPHGPAQWYKQANRGLYGGGRIQFGNTSGAERRQRERRTWGLNVKRKRLWSEALNQTVQLNVTTSVMRTIDRFGGLDEYLLGEKTARIKELGETGWWLRWAIMQTASVKARFVKDAKRLEAELAKEMKEMGIDPKEETASTVEDTPSYKDVNQMPSELRRLSFRVDKEQQVVFTGRTWAKTQRADTAAWERDLAKTAQMCRTKFPSADEPGSDIEDAARYIQASIPDKELQRGMPVSIVSHRRWWKQSGRHLAENARRFGQKPAEVMDTLLRQSLQPKNHAMIAAAVQKREKATAWRR